MRAVILAVGSELLGTDRLDTNSLELTSVLERYGVELSGKSVLGDDVAAIAGAIEAEAARVDLILVTGGLGPTADDVTREAVSRATGLRLVEQNAIVEDIRARFASFGREMPESNRRQALVPETADVLDNPWGTAPGLRVVDRQVTVFLFPGVPRELRGMIERHFEPWLGARGGARKLRRTVRVACLPESEVEERLAPVYERHGEVGILASPGDVRVRLEAATEAALATMEADVRSVLGNSVYGIDDDDLETVVGRLLVAQGRTLATAESCTGGWIAQRMTAVPGISACFLGGVVAYDNSVKQKVLGVPPDVLAEHGAVSAQVASAMAAGARRLLAADFAVAVSGIAGPGGGSAEKPVGTVEIALAGPDDSVSSSSLRLPGDREFIRLLTTQWALERVRRTLEEVG